MVKLSDLFTDGVIVAVHVSEWRARLGIESSDIRVDWSADVERAMYLGAHRLADAEAFEAIHKASNEAVRLVERATLPFPMIPAGRYMPAEKLEAVVLDLARYKREFGDAVEAFCEPDTFAAMCARQLTVIEEALASVLKPGLVVGGSDAYDKARERIRAGYPEPADVKACFSLSWSVFSLQSASSATVAALSGEADQVRGLLGDMMGELRTEIREKLEDVLAIVARGGKLGKRTIESALTVVSRVEDLNVWGDVVLGDQARRLRRILESIEVTGELQAVAGLRDVAAALSGDIQAAVQAAEDSLTGLGRRRLAVA